MVNSSPSNTPETPKAGSMTEDVLPKLKRIFEIDWSAKLIEQLKSILDENKRFNTLPHGMKRPVDFKVVGLPYTDRLPRDMWYDCTAVRDEQLPHLSSDDLVDYFCVPGLTELAHALVEVGPMRIGHRQSARPLGGVLRRVYPGKIPVRLIIESDLRYMHTRIMFDIRAMPLDDQRAERVAQNKNIVRIDLETPFTPSGIVRVDINERFNPPGVVDIPITRTVNEDDLEWAPDVVNASKGK